MRPHQVFVLAIWAGLGINVPAEACTCGDVSGDDRVDLVDFLTFSVCFGLSTPNDVCSAGEILCMDLDASGSVDLNDFQHSLQIDAEVALALLSRFIADCSTRLDQAAEDGEADAGLLERLTRQRDEARQRRRALDVADATAVKAVLDTYGPLVRASAG